jgi:ADP-ribosyl-[dinitrogen reductase] hydrolase
MSDAARRPDISRFEGCLIGLAVGDALGAPAQGFTRHEIRARWGRIAGFLDGPELRAGQCTDDTQTAVVLAETIVRAGRFDAQSFAQGLVDWWARGYARRPGEGLAEACQRLVSGVVWSDSGSTFAGCAAASRVAPIGMRDCVRRGGLADDAVTSSMVTHRDPRAVAGAVGIAAAVAHLLTAHGPLDVASFVEVTAATCGEYSPEMARTIRGLLDLLDLAPRQAMEELGYTGFALEAVPAAIYCFCAARDDFVESVLLPVNTGGAADSIAAMAGALSGAHLGLTAIPPHWTEGVEGSAHLQQLAREIHALA